MATDMTVANTILAQLGGNRFVAMTGAKSFSGGADCLTFRLPRTMTKNRIQAMRITLDASDTYTVTALAQKSAPTHEVYTVDEASMVYCDMLREVFENMTGLRTSL